MIEVPYVRAPPGYVASGLVMVRHATYSAGYISALLACASTAAGFSLGKQAVSATFDDLLGFKGEVSFPLRLVDFVETATMHGFHSAEVLLRSLVLQADTYLGQYGLSHEELLLLLNPGSASSALYLSTTVVTNLFRKTMKQGTIAELVKGFKRLSVVHEQQKMLGLDSIRGNSFRNGLVSKQQVDTWEWGFNIALCACGAQMLKFLGFLSQSMSDTEAIASIAGIDDVLAASWSSDVYKPAHFVGIDYEKRAIVVSIRGTMQVRDILTDLVCEQTSFESVESDDVTDFVQVQGKVHKGFLESAMYLSVELLGTVVTALNANPGFSVFICGHSLGGGVASLLTLIWARKEAFRSRSTRIRGLAYGAPCSVCPDLASTPFTRKYVTSIVLDDDFVSRLSLGSATESFMHAIKLGQEKTGCLQRHTEIANEIVSEAEELKLYPAGQVFHLMHNSTRDPTSFSRINISSSMFTVHMPNRYYDEIKKLKAEVYENNKVDLLVD